MKLTQRQIKLVKESLEYISRSSKSIHLNNERSDIWERLDQEQTAIQLGDYANMADLINKKLIG